ncbi:MAG: hypothetical protein RL348_1319 [Bacteroidota bacterium]|jgi:hypothetical protein
MDIKRLVNKNRIGSEFWINSENKSFTEIIKANITMPGVWASSQPIVHSFYYDNILKPINGYAKEFWPRPKIIKNNETIHLRYFTHAEIWFQPMRDGLYALDKTWQRQFYPSEISVGNLQGYFNACYKFYIPWIFDENLTLSIKEIEDSPFKILNTKVNFYKLNQNEDWNCDWFHFLIKSEGDHIEKYNDYIYGVIPINTPICDIIIENKEIINKVEREYGK